MNNKSARNTYLKEPVALLWIIFGLLAAVGCMILIERAVVRY